METKHTQGEWKYNVTKRDEIQVLLPNGLNLHLGYIYSDDCGLPTCCRKEEHANAKLIAAAPDLLAAALQIKNEIDTEGLLQNSYEKLLAAVEKATK